VTAKVTNTAYEMLTGLALVDQTNTAEQIRLALDFYFTKRMQNRTALAQAIAAERARHEAALSAITGVPKTTTKVSQKATPAAASTKTAEESLTRPVTLRIDSDTLDRLTAFSLIDEKTLAEVLREAVDDYSVHRRLDPQLAAKLDAARRNVDQTLAVLVAGPNESDTTRTTSSGR